jgi:prepilin-type N-terminal cleavage/methylation domain-containing protein
MKKMLKGFTLVEIMIVVAIIAILAAVAIPNFISYRKQSQATACVANMKQIQSAKEMWYMNNSTDPSLNDLVGSEKKIKTNPVCPAGGTYTVGDSTTDPSCSIGTTLGSDYKHQLPSAEAAAGGGGGEG